MLGGTTSTSSSPAAYGAPTTSQGALLAVILRGRCAERAAAGTDVELGHERLEELRSEIARALEEAREAEEAGGFWGDIAGFLGEDLATIAGAIAAAAAVVATGGAGAPLVIAALAAGLQFGAKVGAELGLDPELAMTIGLAGAALGLFTGNAGQLGSLAGAARGVESGARIAQGTFVAGGAVAGMAAQSHRGDAQRSHAQVSFARYQEGAENIEIDEAIERLRSALEKGARATQIASSVNRDDETAARAVLQNIGEER